MEYKLECPGFFLRTETCTGPVNRFDAAALAPERQTLALEGLPMAASVRLLGLLADQLTRMEVRFQPVFSPDFPGEPEALLIGPLLILPGTLLTDPDARLAACHLPLAHPAPAGKPWNRQPCCAPTGNGCSGRDGSICSPAPLPGRNAARRSALMRTPPRSAVWGTAHCPGVCPGRKRHRPGGVAHRSGRRRTADRRRLPRRLAHPAAGGPLRRLCP